MVLQRTARLSAMSRTGRVSFTGPDLAMFSPPVVLVRGRSIGRAGWSRCGAWATAQDSLLPSGHILRWERVVGIEPSARDSRTNDRGERSGESVSPFESGEPRQNLGVGRAAPRSNHTTESPISGDGSASIYFPSTDGRRCGCVRKSRWSVFDKDGEQTWTQDRSSATAITVTAHQPQPLEPAESASPVCT